MIDKITQKENIKKFVERYSKAEYQDEKQNAQTFWDSLLHDVFGIENCSDIIAYQKRVKFRGKHVCFIDAYIASTKVLIEHKSGFIDLAQQEKQSDGEMLTPFEQAKRYSDALPYNEKPRYIVTCNFKSFEVYDMNQPLAKPQLVLLQDLEKEWTRLQFIADEQAVVLQKELEVSIKAGELVGKIYDAFTESFKAVRGEELSSVDLHSLNVLCVRLVFCLYAEDAGIFNKDQFCNFMKSFRTENMREGLKKLFEILDTKECERDSFLEQKYKNFPYVNGNLFKEQEGEVIPTITDETADVLLNKASLGFDWSDISPTIFGAVFESTLNPETRRKGGMHYTSIENIHKVIDPLFLNVLKSELAEIKRETNDKRRKAKLLDFRKKLGRLRFFDPACGSGNFLTETYISLRKLENEALSLAYNGESVLDVMGDIIYVNIRQFYGIEINDFAATVAKTALWIAESQMMEKTAEILHRNLDFLPLKSYSNIIVGNALQIDWKSILPEGQFDYIIGNPPFVGARLMSAEQKQDLLNVFGKDWKNIGNLDYVCGWYKKCADMVDCHTRCGLVSTNSVSQGEMVADLWKPLFENGIQIDFAYRTFRWDNEGNNVAHVHCVIIGFSRHTGTDAKSSIASKSIFNEDGSITLAKNINAYLIDGENTYVESRNEPLCDVPEIGIGNQPIDNGNYLFKKEEMEDFIKKEPASKDYFKPWYGAEEFIHRSPRYCLWLGDCSPAELHKMPKCMERVENVRIFRQASKRSSTLKLADKPTRFQVENMPKGNYLVIPQVSSEKRRYIPIGYMSDKVMCSDKVRLMPKVSLYHFGVLTSMAHMAWMRTICCRLKSDYSYTVNDVYNNFPWPSPSESQKQKIEETAQAILDARNAGNNANCSLADLYDETTMPIELRNAHRENDRAVMAAYGFKSNMTEPQIVAELLKMYQTLAEQKKSK